MRRKSDLTAYFDDECGLCTGAVDFARRNGAQAVAFEPLASESGRAAAPADSNSIVVVREGTRLLGSDAVLALASELRFPYPQLARIAQTMPRGMRDRAYAWVATNRHRFFGRRKFRRD